MKQLLVVGLALSLFAASAEAGRGNKRERSQQNRIQQGVQSGELTKREAAKLNAGQNHIDQLQDQAKSDGNVSYKEKHQIEKAQDRQSKKIYRQKHDKQNR